MHQTVALSFICNLKPCILAVQTIAGSVSKSDACTTSTLAYN